MESLDRVIETLDTFPMCLSLPTSKEFDAINDRLKTDVKEKTEQLKGIHYIWDFYKVCEQLEKTVKLTIIASKYAEKQELENRIKKLEDGNAETNKLLNQILNKLK